MAAYVARCRMVLHDNLYYASREFGRFYETEKYLHNYGLTYALGLVQPAPAYFHATQEPHYREELLSERVGGVYVTPASPLRVDFAFITFKMATVPYYSKMEPESRNRVVFGRAKELSPGSTFEFFVFAEEQKPLPRWVRLGKWMSKAEITHEWYRLGSQEAIITELRVAQRVACPINPLDIDQRRLKTFDIIIMPPASMLSNVYLTGPCCLLSADERFHDKPEEKHYVPLNMRYFYKESINA